MTNHPSSSSLLLLLLNIALTIATFFMNINPCHASRKPASLYHPPPQLLLTYHHGPLLQGPIPISILWYGHFSPPQKSIITDFILSLTPPHQLTTTPTTTNSVPPVSTWWKTVHLYLQMARKNNTRLFLSAQTTDPKCSLGKSLSRTQLSELAARTGSGGLALILTAEDVTVEGFCMSSCGLHSSLARAKPYVWVGNSATQCPGQCAWPFHEPLYGPRGPPLGPPNGDVGADGMVINLGTLLAGAVTNPFGSGFFGGPGEVVGACAGVFGKGAYPGYAGELRVDLASGGSYNVEGVRGRKYLVPAMLDPSTYTCSPVV